MAPDELGAGVSSAPRSSKSTRGAAGAFATPLGREIEAPPEVETDGGTEPALLLLKVASSRTGILSTNEDLKIQSVSFSYKNIFNW